MPARFASLLNWLARKLLPPGAAAATFWAVDSNWGSIVGYAYGVISVGWDEWFTNNIATLPSWVAALVAALTVLTLAVSFRNWQLGERLTPKLRLVFDPTSSAQMREVKMADGSPAVYVRVLPICETAAQINDCKGHLNGVYRRKTEDEKWEPTDLNERLTLTWANVPTVRVALVRDFKQHLDVLIAYPNGDIAVPMLQGPPDIPTIFRSDDFYRLDIVVTGVDMIPANIHLQVRRTSDWRKPHVRVLGPSELEIKAARQSARLAITSSDQT